jgi:hypothetical protein
MKGHTGVSSMLAVLIAGIFWAAPVWAVDLVVVDP